MLLAVLCALVVLSLRLGRYPLTSTQILHALVSPRQMEAGPDSAAWTVVRLLRLPRVLLAALCGIGLALSGAAMQGVFRNPLVGPEIAGVSSGASFGGALAILWAFPLPGVVGTAFAFGSLALLAAFALARLAGQGRMLALVLAGVITAAFFGALTSLVELLADPNTTLPSILFWLMGSFTEADYPKLTLMAATLLTAGTALLALRWRINLLSLGETDAAALGVNLHGLRWTIVALTAAIVAVQVAVSGGVGWVGLIIPHLARMLVGPEHTRMLPVAAVLGGIYVLAIDDLARSLNSTEIPIGLLTAIVGAPVFGYLFWKTQGRGWSRE